MRAAAANLSIGMNVETKKEAEAMFDSRGVSLTVVCKKTEKVSLVLLQFQSGMIS
jgi:hypothetical protein